MAKKYSKIFTVHLGTQTLSLAEFQVTASGELILHSLVHEKIMPIFSLNDLRNEQCLKNILHTWRKEKKIKEGEKLIISLPSQFFFTRFLKLPGIRSEEIPSIIKFEAQQNIPFPLDEIIWDYQIMSSSKEEDSELLLIAGKKTAINTLKREILKTGFVVERIEIASVALYNALCFNYVDAEECSVLLDIGFYSTNIIFWEEEKFFSRTILLGSATGSSSTIIDRMYMEIERSISFYCSRQKGHLPYRILLYGCGAVEIPDLGKILKERQQTCLSFFHPLQKVKCSSEEIIKEKINISGEVVGLAIYGLKKAVIDINLLKKEVIYELNLNQKKKFLTVASISFILVLFIIWMFLLWDNLIQSIKLKEIEYQTVILASHAKKFSKLQKESKKIKIDLIPFIKAVKDQIFWLNLLNTLEESLPSKFIWVNRLEPIIGNKPIMFLSSRSVKLNKERPDFLYENRVADHLLVEGFYLENPEQATVVDRFVQKLSQSSVFDISDSAKVIRVRDTPDGKHWAYKYTLVLPLCRFSQK